MFATVGHTAQGRDAGPGRLLRGWPSGCTQAHGLYQPRRPKAKPSEKTHKDLTGLELFGKGLGFRNLKDGLCGLGLRSTCVTRGEVWRLLFWSNQGLKIQGSGACN